MAIEFSTAAPDLNEHRLDMLMDYTKFHIGLYATLITGLLALAAFGGERYVTPRLRRALYIPILFVLGAGMCGGIIASNLPEQTSFDRFWNGYAKVWGFEFRTRCVAWAEHAFFWAAVVSGLLVILIFSRPGPTSERPGTTAARPAPVLWAAVLSGLLAISLFSRTGRNGRQPPSGRRRRDQI